MPDREDQDGVGLFFLAIQRDVSSAAARNDQLSQIMFCRTTYQRMILQHLHRFEYQCNSIQRHPRFAIQQEIHQSIQITKRLPRIDQLRQSLAFGSGTLRPRTRSPM